MRNSADLWRKLRRRWIVAFTVGELLGFGGVPVLCGLAVLWLTTSLPPQQRSLLTFVVAVLGGFAEGAILASFQRPLVRELWPQIDGRKWVHNTAVAAAAAWALGMLPTTLDDLFGLSTAFQIALWVPASIGILLSIGAAQAIVLRAVCYRANEWIGANAVGWLLGLPWTFVAPAVLPDDSPLWAFGLAFVLGGILMGATVGGVTGWWLTKRSGVRLRASRRELD